MGRSLARAALLAAFGVLALRFAPADARSPDAAVAQGHLGERDLYLEVFVNGEPSDLVGHFRQAADGTFTVEPEELREVGIRPADEARGPGGRIRLDRLPDVRFAYDEAAQTLAFETGGGGRSARVVDAGATGGREASIEPETGAGALLNYSLLAATATGAFDRIWAVDGVSALLEPRLYGPFGVLDHAMLVSGEDGRFGASVRLGTTWSWSSVGSLLTLRAGDVVTGGLSWTRPVRLGGLQIQSDFGLRPDLVTFPVPRLSGSAAVPSTVDVYLDNARRYTADVPAGPFEIANLPVVEGGTTARVVVTDPQGVEVVTQTPFFASTRLLAPGLADYSAEVGFARRFFGLRSDDYDTRPMGSASLRYGWSDTLTLEAHAEGGEGLANAGLGTVFALGPFGVGALSAAGSRSDRGTGVQFSAQAQIELADLVLSARSQRSFGAYDDIASVTGEPLAAIDGTVGLAPLSPPRALDQIALSVPLPLDGATLSLSLARLETQMEEASEIAGASFSYGLIRNATVFASGFSSLDADEIGVFAGLSIALGERTSAAITGFGDDRSAGGTFEIARSASQAVGDHGWRVRAGAGTASSASATYNAASARLDASIEHFDGAYRADLRADGAVVAAGGGVHLTRRVEDAFAVVDVGAAGVEVFAENRSIGLTRGDGRILVPNLRSNEANDLSFDPAALPLDVAVPATRRQVTPARRSGARIDFGIEPGTRSTLLTLRRPDGSFVAAGSLALGPDGSQTLVGYDGQAFLPVLTAQNAVVVEDAERGRCRALVSAAAGALPAAEAVCTPDGGTF